MTDADEVDLAELRDKTATQSRLAQVTSEDTNVDDGQATDDRTSERNEPVPSSNSAQSPEKNTGEDEMDELVSAIDSTLNNLEGNDKVITVWDEDLAAVLEVLLAQPDIVDPDSKDLQEVLRDQANGAVSRSDILRLFLHAGLKQVAPEIATALLEAKRRQVNF